MMHELSPYLVPPARPVSPDFLFLVPPPPPTAVIPPVVAAPGTWQEGCTVATRLLQRAVNHRDNKCVLQL